MTDQIPVIKPTKIETIYRHLETGEKFNLNLSGKVKVIKMKK